MPAETFEQQLDRAAAVCGIDPGFWDIWGRYHATTQEAKRAILHAMGIPSETPAELEHAFAQMVRREWETLVPPSVVARQGPVEFALSVPAESLGERAHVTIRREDGKVEESDLNLWD